MLLAARSETIVQAITDRNSLGIIKSEEAKPGIFIGTCLVKPEEYACPVSIINYGRTRRDYNTIRNVERDTGE